MNHLVRAIIALVAVVLTVAAGDGPFAWSSPTTAPGLVRQAAAADVSMASVEAAEAAVQRWQGLLETTSKTLDRVAGGDAPIPEFRDELTGVRWEARDLAASLAPSLVELRAQLERLGPAPEAGGTPESPSVAESRAGLEREVSRIDGLVRSAELIATRSESLISRLENLRRQRFTRAVLEQTASPLLPELWRGAWQQQLASLDSLATIARAWWRRAAPQWRLALLFVAAIAIGLLLHRGLARVEQQRDRIAASEPAFIRRADVALQTALARAIPWLVPLLAIYLGLAHIDLLPQTTAPVIAALLWGVAIVVCVRALSKSLVAPRRPQWRVFPLPDDVAPRIHRRVVAMAGVYAVSGVLRAVNAATLAPLQVTIVQDFILGLIFSALFAALLIEPWRRARDGEGRASRLWPAWLKIVVWLLVAVVVAASAAGYVALGQFLIGQVIVTGSVLLAAWLLHLGISELSADVATKGRPASRLLDEVLEASPIQSRFAGLAISGLLNLVLIVLVVPLVLLQWGFSFDRIRGWLEAAFFGFQVGSINISIARILVAVALFAGVLVLLNLLRRWLDENILVPPQVEAGLANSIRTGVGYLGYALAAAAGVSYMGLDFTNLAIVAGALSVGIGFGLQSIVNNFVSGLILLVERPIQVGDWVVAGDAEGYVKRISVRSTEIETFDRASVIVPNSELVAGRVTNFTHRNKMGRVVVRIGVSYAADPEEVMALLTEIGSAHPLVLVWPKPTAAFEDFGASSLDFSLRVFIADINNILSVRNDLRIAILKALRERNIEIPFPQQDVHLRDLDDLRAALARARERVASERSSDEK
ncbi:MAG: DUF3772 domain-containing protein [Rhizobiales bacterium]|nr:DUF3772 domain-containing protein [Hyphomicrobiales bacterium]